MHLLQSARTMCRVLDKLGESDSDNVHRRTDVVGMVAFPGGWGRFHVKPKVKRPTECSMRLCRQN